MFHLKIISEIDSFYNTLFILLSLSLPPSCWYSPLPRAPTCPSLACLCLSPHPWISERFFHLLNSTVRLLQKDFLIPSLNGLTAS